MAVSPGAGRGVYRGGGVRAPPPVRVGVWAVAVSRSGAAPGGGPPSLRALPGAPHPAWNADPGSHRRAVMRSGGGRIRGLPGFRGAERSRAVARTVNPIMCHMFGRVASVFWGGAWGRRDRPRMWTRRDIMAGRPASGADFRGAWAGSVFRRHGRRPYKQASGTPMPEGRRTRQWCRFPGLAPGASSAVKVDPWGGEFGMPPTSAAFPSPRAHALSLSSCVGPIRPSIQDSSSGGPCTGNGHSAIF